MKHSSQTTSPSHTHQSEPDYWGTVAAPSGTFHTVREGGVVRARGIRYAEAERFGAPEPYDYGDEPFLADTPAPACPQRHKESDVELVALGFDEHCQRLTVTRPDTDETGLPVMIWIHGGSYTGGAGDIPHYDPRWLVTEQNIVVVNVTYRLGLLGYLGDGVEREANAGLLDQVEAVKWVARNIAAFGGDPGAVTVAGQSAGGHACWDLLMVDELRGMIRRAIVQSAPLGIVHQRSPSIWKALTPSAESTEAMRSASAEDLVAGAARIDKLAMRQGAAKYMPFSTKYGARPLPPEDQLEERWREAAGDVEILMGTTAREVALFTGAIPPLLRLAETRWGSRGVVQPLIRRLTTSIYRHDAERWARIFREAGGRVGLYEFGYGCAEHVLSCCHISELPLLFPHPAWRVGTEEAGAGVTGPEIMDTYDPHTVYDAGRALRDAWGTFVRGGLGDTCGPDGRPVPAASEGAHAWTRLGERPPGVVRIPGVLELA